MNASGIPARLHDELLLEMVALVVEPEVDSGSETAIEDFAPSTNPGSPLCGVLADVVVVRPGEELFWLDRHVSIRRQELLGKDQAFLEYLPSPRASSDRTRLWHRGWDVPDEIEDEAAVREPQGLAPRGHVESGALILLPFVLDECSRQSPIAGLDLTRSRRCWRHD